MIVSIRVAEESGATATLVDGDNLQQFHVEVDGVGDVAAALGAAWSQQFASTVDYAARKGWRSDDEQYLQAHVVRLGEG